MKKTICIPPFREESNHGVFCVWLKQEGERFQKGDALYEVETDKVVESVEAEEDGLLCRKIVEEGDTVQTNTPVAEVEVQA